MFFFLIFCKYRAQITMIQGAMSLQKLPNLVKIGKKVSENHSKLFQIDLCKVA